jgi:hypothetical protein
MSALATYTPLPRSVIEADDAHWLVQELAAHVQALLGSNWHPLENAEHVSGIPDRVKVAWYLWWFACEVCGNGFNGYLENGVATCRELQNIRRCLKEVGDDDMLTALEAGIALCRPSGTGFWEEAEALACFGQLRSEPWKSIAKLDEIAMTMAGDPLDRHVQTFLLVQKDVL